MKIAIIYCTGRQEPHLDWAIDDVRAQANPEDDIALIVIDALFHTRMGSIPLTPPFKTVVHALPKPNPWQGRYRLTDRDWFALSNARNTGIVSVPNGYDYVAFLDDRAHLGPNWLATLRDVSSTRKAVIAGSYEKRETKDDGTEYTTGDHRRRQYPRGLPNCGGGWLFGCSMAMPLEWLLECNGLEEGVDGMGMEDCLLGLNLANNGHRIDFVPELFVSQDRTRGNASTKGGLYAGRDKGVSPRDKSHAALDRFKGRKRTEFTPDLRALHDASLRSEREWPLPDPDMRDWYDGELIREMRPG